MYRFTVKERVLSPKEIGMYNKVLLAMEEVFISIDRQKLRLGIVHRTEDVYRPLERTIDALYADFVAHFQVHYDDQQLMKQFFEALWVWAGSAEPRSRQADREFVVGQFRKAKHEERLRKRAPRTLGYDFMPANFAQAMR